MVVAYIFVLYLMVHLYMATLGHTIFAHTKAMVVGFQEEEEEPERGGAGGRKKTGRV